MFMPERSFFERMLIPKKNNIFRWTSRLLLTTGLMIGAIDALSYRETESNELIRQSLAHLYFSPDGTNIAFAEKVKSHDNSSFFYKIHVLNYEGEDKIAFTLAPGDYVNNLSWSLDGIYIAFNHDARNAVVTLPELYTKNTNILNVKTGQKTVLFLCSNTKWLPADKLMATQYNIGHIANEVFDVSKLEQLSGWRSETYP